MRVDIFVALALPVASRGNSDRLQPGPSASPLIPAPQYRREPGKGAS